MKKILALLLCVLALATAATAQLQTENTLLDHLAGTWVMTGDIAGGPIVHDVVAEWVLAGHYLRLHEVAREKDEHGAPAYEAIIFLGRNEPEGPLVCMWLDVTGGAGLVPDGFGYAHRTGDELPFVWGDDATGAIHNTFAYDRDADLWRWSIDNVKGDERRPFARVTLKRAADHD